MRILHVYKDYHPPTKGGIEYVVEQMARRQAAAGHDVTVLTANPSSPRTVDERLDGVRVVRCAEWMRLASTPFCPTMAPWLARLPADLYHLHYPSPTGEVSYALTRPRGPLVVSYHGDVVRQAAVMPLYGVVARWLLDRAEAIIVSSDAYVRRSDYLRPRAAKCRIVPFGVDPALFDRRARDPTRLVALRARYGSPLTLFVGRLRYYKGVNVLLDAWPHVRGTLVIAGDGPEETRLRAQHTALGLGSRVIFTGEVSEEEKHDLLAAADVGVLPSVLPSEAFGVSLVEMLASSLPAVSTELGTGTSVVNQHGVTGLVVPPRDPGALAGAINTLLDDDALRARFAAAARERACAVYSLDAMMRGVDAVYADLVGAPAVAAHALTRP